MAMDSLSSSALCRSMPTTTTTTASKLAVWGIAIAAAYSLCLRIRSRISMASPPQTDPGDRLPYHLVANVLKRFPAIQAYQALRIPENGHQGHKEINLVLLTKRKLYVVQVRNWSGIVKLEDDGTWSLTFKHGLIQKLPNLVEDAKYCAELLESYIARRGVILPSSFLQYKVVFVNPECRVEEEILSQPEVLSFDRWESLLTKEAKKGLLSWMKSIMLTKNKVALANALQKQLKFILRTSPTWDRLELLGGQIILGDFLHFRGCPCDVEALQIVKRSSVSHLTVIHQQQWMLNFLGMFLRISPEVLVNCTLCDYREDANMHSSKNLEKPTILEYAKSTVEVRVRPDLEVAFREIGSMKVQHLKLTEVLLLSLSA